jgi:hypothetical protein
VHVYFSDEPIDRNAIDLNELARLGEFREEMEPKGLVAVYVDPTDLGLPSPWSHRARPDTMDLGVDALAVVAPPAHAMPRLRYHELNKRLVVENISNTERADQLVLEIPDGS